MSALARRLMMAGLTQGIRLSLVGTTFALNVSTPPAISGVQDGDILVATFTDIDATSITDVSGGWENLFYLANGYNPPVYALIVNGAFTYPRKASGHYYGGTFIAAYRPSDSVSDLVAGSSGTLINSSTGSRAPAAVLDNSSAKAAITVYSTRSPDINFTTENMVNVVSYQFDYWTNVIGVVSQLKTYSQVNSNAASYPTFKEARNVIIL